MNVYSAAEKRATNQRLKPLKEGQNDITRCSTNKTRSKSIICK